MKNRALVGGWILISLSTIFAIIYAYVADTWHREASAAGLLSFSIAFLICGMVLLFGHFDSSWDK